MTLFIWQSVHARTWVHAVRNAGLLQIYVHTWSLKTCMQVAFYTYYWIKTEEMETAVTTVLPITLEKIIWKDYGGERWQGKLYAAFFLAKPPGFKKWVTDYTIVRSAGGRRDGHKLGNEKFVLVHSPGGRTNHEPTGILKEEVQVQETQGNSLPPFCWGHPPKASRMRGVEILQKPIKGNNPFN